MRADRPHARRHRRRRSASSKSSVSLWVRDIDIEIRAPATVVDRRPHPQHLAKLAEIEECDRVGRRAHRRAVRRQAFLAAGAALYAGEGAKRDGKVLLREHRSGDGRVLLRLAASVLRRSTSRACVSACTCTRASTSTRPSASGRSHRRPASAVPSAVPGEGRSDDPADQARARLRLRRLLLLAHASRDHGAGPGAAILGRHSGVAQLAERAAC